MMTMKQGQSDRAQGGGKAATAATTSSALLFLATITCSHLIGGAHATTTAGYEFVAVGGCRDTNNNIYSNIRLPSNTAATSNTACAQSCNVFRTTVNGFQGYEYQVVYGSDTRCYCLFDSGTDVTTLAESVDGDTTVKDDNLGYGEIQSAENVGIDSYCYKVVEVVTEEEEEEEASSAEGTRQGDLDRGSPTASPLTLDEIFAGIDFTTSQVDDNYGSSVDGWNDNTDHNNLNATKSSKIFAAHGGKVAKSKSGKASISMSMECPSSKSSKSSSMSHAMKQSGGGGSSKKPSGGGGDWSDDGWGPSSTRAGDAEMWSNGDSSSSGSSGYGKSEKLQSMKTKTTKVCSKSGKGMSYGLVEGKAGKGGDDWSMAQMLEQMRYKMTNSGEKKSVVGMKWMMMTTSLLIASFVVW